MTFPIPAKALQAHIAILGKTGSGKTVAAKGMVEGLLDAGLRACAIDPTGVWYGLRLTDDNARLRIWKAALALVDGRARWPRALKAAIAMIERRDRQLAGVRNIIFNVEQCPKAHRVEEIIRSMRSSLGLKPGERP